MPKQTSFNGLKDKEKKAEKEKVPKVSKFDKTKRDRWIKDAGKLD